MDQGYHPGSDTLGPVAPWVAAAPALRPAVGSPPQARRALFLGHLPPRDGRSTAPLGPRCPEFSAMHGEKGSVSRLLSSKGSLGISGFQHDPPTNSISFF